MAKSAPMKCCYPGCRTAAIIPVGDNDKWFCQEHFDAYLAEQRPPEDPAAKAERDEFFASERAHETLKDRIMHGRAHAVEVDLRFIARQNEQILEKLRGLSTLNALSGIREDLGALREEVRSGMNGLRHEVIMVSTALGSSSSSLLSPSITGEDRGRPALHRLQHPPLVNLS